METGHSNNLMTYADAVKLSKAGCKVKSEERDSPNVSNLSTQTLSSQISTDELPNSPKNSDHSESSLTDMNRVTCDDDALLEYIETRVDVLDSKISNLTEWFREYCNASKRPEHSPKNTTKEKRQKTYQNRKAQPNGNNKQRDTHGKPKGQHPARPKRGGSNTATRKRKQTNATGGRTTQGTQTRRESAARQGATGKEKGARSAKGKNREKKPAAAGGGTPGGGTAAKGGRDRRPREKREGGEGQHQKTGGKGAPHEAGTKSRKTAEKQQAGRGATPRKGARRRNRARPGRRRRGGARHTAGGAKRRSESEGRGKGKANGRGPARTKAQTGARRKGSKGPKGRQAATGGGPTNDIKEIAFENADAHLSDNKSAKNANETFNSEFCNQNSGAAEMVSPGSPILAGEYLADSESVPHEDDDLIAAKCHLNDTDGGIGKEERPLDVRQLSVGDTTDTVGNLSTVPAIDRADIGQAAASVSPQSAIPDSQLMQSKSSSTSRDNILNEPAESQPRPSLPREQPNRPPSGNFFSRNFGRVARYSLPCYLLPLLLLLILLIFPHSESDFNCLMQFDEYRSGIMKTYQDGPPPV
ncbi:hypothetical protein TYRP_013592 [Tyrophagus putrescentiae]|nr:hypothetical protein TYRP_013592 [Tyrophagus putrescentiae]